MLPCGSPDVDPRFAGDGDDGRKVAVLSLPMSGAWRCFAVGLFFVSGACGLVYELLWVRKFELLFGATSDSVGAVLAAFMGGLGLGGYLGGRFLARVRRPFFVYGTLELFIGFYALILPYLFVWISKAYLAWGTVGPLFLTRLLCAAALILLPTLCMGATLPILVRAFEAAWPRSGSTSVPAGFLYSINTLGAVVGVLLSGYALIPLFGQLLSGRLAALANILLGSLAWYLASRSGPVAAWKAPPKGSEGNGRGVSPRWVWVCAFGFGWASMFYEVGFTRVLVMMLGSSVYALSAILAAFLLGLGSGSLATSRPSVLGDAKSALRWLAWSQVGALLAVGFLFFLVPTMPRIFLDVFQSLTRNGWGSGPLQLALQGLLSVLGMLPLAFFLGASFPCLLRLLEGQGETSANLGKLYAVNTLGCVSGSLAATFVFVPWVGLQVTLKSAAAINLLLSLGCFILLARWGGQKRGTILAMGALLGGALIVFPASWDPHVLTTGPYFQAVKMFKEWEPRVLLSQRLRDIELAYYREGRVMTVSVERFSDGGLMLSSNGKVEASSAGDLPTQEMVAHLPLVWFEGMYGRPANRVCLVGLASGITAGAALAHPLERLEVVELEPVMSSAASLFAPFNGDAQSDPRYRILVDDARHHLNNSSGTYDVVISEPSNPWISGVSNLFTRESFQQGRRALRPGGVFAQWVQVYGLSEENVKGVIATFASVYPNVAVFGIPPVPGDRLPAGDIVLLGSDNELRPSLGAMEKCLSRPAVRSWLSRIGVEGAGDMVAMLRLNPGQVSLFAGDAPLNTDDNVRVEFSAPWNLYADTYLPNMEAIHALQADPSPWFREDDLSSAEARRVWERAAVCLHRYWSKKTASLLRLKAATLGAKGRRTEPR